MKLERTGVVLLGLLLMVSVVMSFAAAEGVTSGEAIIGDQNQACASCSIPESGVASYVSGSETNLLMEFGIDEPKISDNAPQLQPYSECKDLANEIMENAKLDDDTDAVIGLYDLEQYQILLIDRGDAVLEAVYDGESVTIYTLIPELLGEKKVSYSPKKVSLEGQETEECSFTTETATQLYSVPIKVPDTAVIMADQYTVTVTRTDEYKTNLVVRGRLVTKGDFYVNYGQNISGIADQTTWNVYVPWGRCEFSSSSSGSGTTSGQVNGHLKLGLLYNRAQMDAWVSCNAWLTTNDGGSQNEWLSTMGDGCTS